MIYKHSLKNTQWLRHKVKKAHFINGRIGECRRLPVQAYFKVFGKKTTKKKTNTAGTVLVEQKFVSSK